MSDDIEYPKEKNHDDIEGNGGQGHNHHDYDANDNSNRDRNEDDDDGNIINNSNSDEGSSGAFDDSFEYLTNDDGDTYGNYSDHENQDSCNPIQSNETNAGKGAITKSFECNENGDNCTDDASEYFTCEESNDVDDLNAAGIHLSVQTIKSCDVFSTKRYENVMKELEDFQTQTNWKQHKLLTTCLRSSATNIDFKIVLLLEQGMAEVMQKHFPCGKKLFRQALQLSLQSKNLCLLQGRALMFLGNAYRKEGPTKYGKAFRCLTLAQQNLCQVESEEDKAEINYLLGVLYLNFLCVSFREPSKKSRDRIEEHYQAVYDHAITASASRVREKIQKIFPLGMANFLLDGQTEIARSRVVPEAKVKKAESCLKYFAAHFPFDEQPVSMQTDYCKSMSDLEYRKGNLYLSQDFLHKGLRIAKRFDYHLEVHSLEKRLSMLEKCLPQAPTSLPREDTAGFADRSDSADSEILVFSPGSE